MLFLRFLLRVACARETPLAPVRFCQIFLIDASNGAWIERPAPSGGAHPQYDILEFSNGW